MSSYVWLSAFFFQIGLNEEELLATLQDDGFDIGETALVRLRHKHGLRRRCLGEEQIRRSEAEIRRIVTEELAKGTIDGYGCGYLYTHFRQRGHIMARDRLFQIYHTINPEATERRKRDMQRHKG